MKLYRRAALCGILLAAAMVFSYVEFLFPINFLIPVPGIKLGLANIVIIIAYVSAGKTEAFTVMILRCVLSSLLFGSVTSFLFSLFGGVLAFLSLSLMLNFKGYNKFYSLAGISVVSALCHNLGQISAAMLIFKTFAFMSYYPLLMVSAVITGFAAGSVAMIVLKNIKVAEKNA